MFSAATKTGAAAGYQISRSLRFNSADSAYLTRTFSSAGNRRTWTWSAWVKQSEVDGFRNMFTSNIFTAATDSMSIRLYLNVFKLDIFNSGSGIATIQTDALIRDYSAWYHFVCAVDTTQATASNRVKLYINGVQQTVTGTYPAQNYEYPIGSTSWANAIGAWNTGAFGMNGYMTEMYFIDGQALTSSSFGETNAQTGVWQPKAYSGSYGTNGFYLNFSDNSNTTAATLGKDYSGNGNNWTPNNFSVAAGAGNDSLVDSPTAYGTDTGAGGTVRGNYCTLNALKNTAALSDGNLTSVNAGMSGYYTSYASMSMDSGKYYWEIVATDDGVNARYAGFGIADPSVALTGITSSALTGSQAANSRGWTQAIRSSLSAYGTGLYNNGGTVNSTTRATTTGTRIFMVAYDADTGKCWMGYEGTWWTGDPAAGTSAYFTATAPMIPVVNPYNDGSNSTLIGSVNFGQRPFAYTAPSGFKALCTQNLPTPTIGATTATQAGKYFNPVLYTGTQTTQSVTGVGFQPDFTWIKDRTTAWTNVLTDAVRGAGKSLYSNSPEPEVTNDSNGYLSAFNSDGFTLAGGLRVNASGDAIVAWNWRANGAGSSNTAGSITSTVSANTTSGFSVVTYTGNGTGTAANGTVGHGLGVVPSMIIIKRRDNTGFWWVATRDGGTSTSPTYSWFTRGSSGLNQSGAAFGTGQTFASSGYITSTTFNVYWLNAAVSAGDSYDINFNTGTYVAYCFASIAGYSAFGSYTGNSSSDGPFIYCGFRPRYVLIKLSSGGLGDWVIYDAVRNTSNVMSSVLYADLTNAEGTVTGIDFTSNGFKLRGTSTDFNGGYTYIYAAFAESPFKYALAR